METITERDTVKTITTHYIDGAFVESHGREVMDIIKPTNGKLIGRVRLGDEEDTRRAIACGQARICYFWADDERGAGQQLTPAASGRLGTQR
jgi:aldehyde dehydrogenase (NAD+)